MDVPIRRRRDDAQEEFERLQPSFASELDSWPDFRSSAARALGAALREVAPLADLEETDESYLVDVELPGVQPHDVDLQVQSGRLLLTGERKERRRVGLLRHRTRTSGRFALAVTLPGPVDSDAVTASLDHGVLSIVVPKAERARRRRIEINRSS